ncbi:ubiquitin-conjugating enzyme/RWD-like protein, partial [Dissophora ornata]
TVHENRIYSLKFHCGDQYPDMPPTVSFLSRVNLPCVHPTNGRVDPSKLTCLSNWRRSFGLETVLTDLRRYVVLFVYHFYFFYFYFCLVMYLSRCMVPRNTG